MAASCRAAQMQTSVSCSALMTAPRVSVFPSSSSVSIRFSAAHSLCMRLHFRRTWPCRRRVGRELSEISRGCMIDAKIMHATARADALELEDEGEAGAEGRTGFQFDINVAVIMAGFAFESYNTPKKDGLYKAKDAGGCETLYLSQQFVEEIYSGHLQVKVVKGNNFPAVDLWGSSDPYVSVNVGETVARTRTIWGSLNPQWNEEVIVPLGGPPWPVLKVAAWDANLIAAPRRLGNGSIRLENFCDGERHELEIQLTGPGGGGTVFLEVQYRSFAAIRSEEAKWRLPTIKDILAGDALKVMAPEKLLQSIMGTPTISASDFVQSAIQGFQSQPLESTVSEIRSQEIVEGKKEEKSGKGPTNDDEKSPESSEQKQKQESNLVISPIDVAREALQAAGWLAPEKDKKGYGSTEYYKESGVGRELGVGVVAEMKGVEGGREAVKGGFWKQGLEELIGGLRKEGERRKSEILVRAGLAKPTVGGVEEPSGEGNGRVWSSSDGRQREERKERRDEGAVEGEADTHVEGGDNGTSISPSALSVSIFRQTESLLGSWALLGAGGRKEREGELEQFEGAGGVSMEGALKEREEKKERCEEEEEERASVDSSEKMRALFCSAESAMEAWALLASSLGQHSFVASEFEKICFLDNEGTDTQVALWRDLRGRRLLVAFRGTEQTKLRDLQTDLSLSPVGFGPERASGGNFSEEEMVHGGFLKAYDSIRVRLISLIQTVIEKSENDDVQERKSSPWGSEKGDCSTWQLWVTGHSLGGALATLLSKELLSSRFGRSGLFHLKMYNFGSPRVGNRAFVEKYNELVKDSWRVVNRRDIIPTIPKLMGYCHVASPVFLNARSANGFEVEGQNESEVEEVDDDDISEATPDLLVAEFMRGERQMLERLLQTEMAILSALRDGTALMMHMEDFYYLALLQQVERNLGRGLALLDKSK